MSRSYDRKRESTPSALNRRPQVPRQSDPVSNQAMLTMLGAQSKASDLDVTKGRTVGLEEKLKTRLESHFGYDLSPVQIRESDQAAALGGKAFTQRDQINLQSGVKQNTAEGQKIIAHEVSHIVAQAQNRSHVNPIVGDLAIDSGSEALADSMGNAALRATMQDGCSSPEGLQSLPTFSGAAPIQGWGFANLQAKAKRGAKKALPHNWFSSKRKKNADLAFQQETGHGTFMDSSVDALNLSLELDESTDGLTPMERVSSGILQKRLQENDKRNLMIGTYFNDMGPHNYSARGKSKEHGVLHSVSFLKDFLFGKKSSFAKQTHTGDLQFLHGMKSTSDKSMSDSNRKLNKYAKLAYGLSSDDEAGIGGLNLDSRMSDLYNSEEFNELGFQNVHQFYEKGDMRDTVKKIGSAKEDIQNYEDKKKNKPNAAKWRQKRWDKKITKKQKKLDELENQRRFMMEGGSDDTVDQDDSGKTGTIKKLDKKIKKARIAGKTDQVKKLMQQRRDEFEKYKGATLREMVGVTEATPQGNRAAKNRYMGSLIHTMQDTFATSHTMRLASPSGTDQSAQLTDLGPENDEEALQGVTPITQFADYTVQDEKKHHAGDLLARGEGSEQGTFEGMIKATPGAIQARNVSAHLLKSRAKGRTTNDMRGFFSQLFQMREGMSDEEKGLDESEMTEDQKFAKHYQVPGSSRFARKKKLSKLLKKSDGSKEERNATRSLLKIYESRVGSHERKKGKGNQDNWQRTPEERGNELSGQARALVDAYHHCGSKSGSKFAEEARNDIYDLYINLKSLQENNPELKSQKIVEEMQEILRENITKEKTQTQPV